MKRTITWAVLTLIALIGISLKYTQTASSNAVKHNSLARNATATSSFTPFFATTVFNVDRTDDTAAATACTGAANDCSLRGAIIAANTNLSADPVEINLQPGTTYNLTLANANQENAAATGDLDITTALHTVTIKGGGSSGPSASIIDAAGLTSGTMHDRAFQITASGVTVTFENLQIRNGQAADDGTAGAGTNPATSQNSTRLGGAILNGRGIDPTTQVVIGGGGNLTLTNVQIQSCQVLGKGDTAVNQHTTLEAWGGGLASIGTATVTITGSTFTGNSAVGGNGGNFNNGDASGAKGGSIYFGGGTLNIQNSRIVSSNATGGDGGDGPGNQQNGGGGGAAQGGGAYVIGTATINNTTFESCQAIGGDAGTGQNGGNFGGTSGGGGLYSLGSTTVTNSTFNLNSANGGRGGDAFGPDCFGGHIALDGGAARGGAILADGGSLIINTATFASNSAVGGNGGDGGKTGGGTCSGTQHGAGGLAFGGAITNSNSATVNIKHGTISGNNAQAGNSGVNQGTATAPARLVAEGTGGGIKVGSGTVTVENTIIAGNTAANGAGDTTGAPVSGPDVDGAVTSNGHNLLGNATEATGFTGTGEQIGVNPNLAPLADNGGPTKTMAPNPGSPAIDAGVASSSTTDQRGMNRTYDDPGVANAATSDATDIGAFELQPICTLNCPSDITVGSDHDQCGANVTFTTPGDEACGTVTCDHPSGSFFPVGDTTVKCTSSVGPVCTFKVTVNDTQAPSISAPANANYQCADQVPVADPSQATASDNCGTPTVTVGDASNGGAGSPASPLIITRTYTATDGGGLTATAQQTITVIDNTPPTINCPGNMTVTAPVGTCSAVVTFTPTGSDNCSVPTITTSPASGSVFPVGTTTVLATATDAAGNTRTCTFTVTVKDVTAPVITVNGQSPTLWPPNHQYVSISVADLVASASDLCDPGVNLSSVYIAKVTSDEPENTAGDGNTLNDILIAGNCKSVQLRSERIGSGNGRVYTITFKVTDSSGNSSTATAKVTVPKSQNGNPAVDDGPQYTVLSSCP